MNKRSAIAIFLAILIIFMPGCENYQSWTSSGNNNPKHESVEETLRFLTGDECGGRLVGTDGNLLAQRFLINSLDSFGLEKPNGSFEDQYEYNHLSLDEIIFELEGKEGKKEFVLDKDFSVNKISDSDIRAPLSTENSVSDDCIVLLDNVSNLQEFSYDDKVKGILVKEEDDLKHFTPAETRISDKTMLYVTKDTYDYLMDNIGVTVHLKSGYNVSKKSANNIIGMIKGNGAKKAVILSAHFDHLGSAGDRIFRGALDNASGTAALLDIAKNVSQKINKDDLNMDIFFAFFNSEETGILGSKAFAERIQNEYGRENVLNINIDCVGDIEYPTLNIYSSTDKLKKITKVFIERLNERSITDINDPGNSSAGGDNKWFKNNIYIYVNSPNIHKLKDTMDIIDINSIQKISDSITNLMLNFPDIGETKEQNSAASKKMEYMREESLKLNNFEYKFLDIDGETEYIGRDAVIGPYGEINKCFNGELDKIPLKLLDESILNNQLSIYFSYSDEIKYTTQQLNTVYKRDYSFNDIGFIGIYTVRNLYGPNNVKIRDATNVSVNKIAYGNKEEQRHVYNFYTSDFGSETFDYKGYKLHFKYDEDNKSGKINCLSKNSTDQCAYVYIITDDRIVSFDKDKITALMEEYDILATLEGMEAFMNRPGTTSYENGE